MFKELMQLIKLLFQSSPKKCDKLEIIQMKYFPFSGYSAMTWCGKLITKHPERIDKTTMTHENIHLKQAQQYNSWIGYYLRYLIEWLKGNPFQKPFNSAYYTIPFEVEAYANEHNEDYIANYNSNNLKTKYTFKDKKELFKNFKSLYHWKQYIREL